MSANALGMSKPPPAIPESETRDRKPYKAHFCMGGGVGITLLGV